MELTKKQILSLSMVTAIFLMNFIYANDEPDERLNQIVEEYMYTKDALVHDRTDLSGPWAERLETTLGTTPHDIFEEDELSIWQSYLGSLMDATGDIIESDDIEVHRKALGRLSADLKALLDEFGNPVGDLFVFTCEDDGYDDQIWLNDSEDVANPYYGLEDQGCGELIATL